MYTRTVSVVAAVVCSVLLTGAEVTYYEEAAPISLNPLFASSMVEVRTTELTHDRLAYRSAVSHEVRSRLADIEGSERLEDGLALKVKLKDDIRWHDGKPFTPADICFTIEAMKHRNTPASQRVRAMGQAIDSCEALSRENAVLLRFPQPWLNPWDRLSFSVLPKHAFQSAAVMPTTDYSLRPIGTGPQKAAKGPVAITLTSLPNAHHNAAIPVMKQLVMGDPYAAVSTMMNGSAQGMVVVPPPHRPNIAASDEMALKSYDLRSWWFVALNTNKGALKDKRVRQALDLSIDRTELRKLTVGASSKDPNPPAEFISGPFVGSSPYYNRAVEPNERSDLTQAAQLMNEAGAQKHFNRWVKDGKPITFKIGMNAPLDAEAVDLLNQLGNQLAAAGFDRSVYMISEDDWRRKAVTGQLGDYDMLIGKWSFGVVEDVEPLFHTRTGGKGSLNLFGYSDSGVDGLFKQFDSARTDTEAQDAYHDLHATLADELPYLFLWKLDTKSAWRNEVRGNLVTPYYYFTEYSGWRFDG